MADITGIGEKAGKLSEKLTAYPNSDIFKHDDKKYYKNGDAFEKLDGIRDHKLLPALEAQKAQKDLDDAQKAVIEQAKAMLKTADESLKAETPKEVKLPLARIVEAANQYYGIGDNTNGDKLLNFAIQQAELIEKPDLKKDEKEGKITAQLKEFKAALDEHYKDKPKEVELKGKDEEKSEEQGFSNISKDVARLVANLDSIKLEPRNTNIAMDAKLLAAKKQNTI